MKKILFLGSSAVFLSLAIFSNGAAAQQLKSTEIRGVSLGMSQAEVEASLRSTYPNFVFVKQMPAGQKFSPSIFASPRPQPGSKGPVENFQVDFGQATGRAVLIKRRISSNAPGLAIEPLTTGMSEKYGASANSAPVVDGMTVLIYGRAADLNGKATERCFRESFVPRGMRPSKQPDCAQSLFVTASLGDKVAEGVYKDLTTVLVDHQATYQEMFAAESQGEADRQQAAKRTQDAARAVKPQL